MKTFLLIGLVMLTGCSTFKKSPELPTRSFASITEIQFAKKPVEMRKNVFKFDSEHFWQPGFESQREPWTGTNLLYLWHDEQNSYRGWGTTTREKSFGIKDADKFYLQIFTTGGILSYEVTGIVYKRATTCATDMRNKKMGVMEFQLSDDHSKIEKITLPDFCI